ncbi:MAG: sigma-70 family RNA polymerase sigma factor [Myxococcaceae bacterium]|nr:sigma-70 family RNA polymerase sigma factor [Myxococcaceae bacterium]MCI0669924.1 sigma-70 family RNA polymerase sigma factor [Myxococcaceae bacterium]
MARSDEELLGAARQGDSRALNELLARYERQVYRFGLRMCGSEEAAREVLQQTLLAAFRGLHTFRGEARLSTWLYQVARTHCLRSQRRQVGEPVDFAPLDTPEVQAVPADTAGPDAVAHARQMGEVLQAAILALPESYREALVLKDVEGLDAGEAARVAGVEVAAFKSRLHRARMELRAHLTTLLGGTQPAADAGCPALAQELAEFAAQDVDQATCERIEEHLSRCERCARECDALKRTVSLCRRIPGDEVPAPVRAAVRQALAQAGAAG